MPLNAATRKKNVIHTCRAWIHMGSINAYFKMQLTTQKKMATTTSPTSPSSPAQAAVAQDPFLYLEQGGFVPDTKQQQQECNAIVPKLLAKKLLSEFFGTFVLMVGCVGTSLNSKKPGSTFGINGVAAGASLTVALVIFSTGHVSGAHVNPAVTLAFAALGRFPWVQVPLYSGAQLLGSVAASFLLKQLYHSPAILGAVTVPAETEWHAFIFELLVSSIMMFVVTAVATDGGAEGHLAAIAVGATIYVNNLLASEASGASMNPVRTLGPALAAGEYRGLWVYFLGPILGTQLGAFAYTLVRTDGIIKQAL